MVFKKDQSPTLRILMIGFSPVIRQGLQSILTRDKEIEVIEDDPGWN